METGDLRPVRLSRRSLLNHYHGFLRSLRNKRPETRGTYERALREFIRWFPEPQFRFLVKDIQRYKRHLSQRKKLSEVSVSTYLTAVRRFCDYLVRQRVLRGNPAKSVGGNKRPMTHSREVLSVADVQDLLASVQRNGELGSRDYAFVKLMIGCALSEIEIIRADVCDIKTGDGGTMLAVQGKGRSAKDAAVMLPLDVKESIDQYLAARGNVSLNEPLFTSAGNRTRGSRMTTRGVRDRVNYYLERAGVKKGKLRKVTPYSLRHTAAVMMAEAGASADEIRQRLRLGSVTTAMLYMKNKTVPPSPEYKPPEGGK